jgi:hypothetical protein
VARLALDVVLFYGSLLLALAALVLFLVLMRRPEDPEGPRRPSDAD